MLDEFFHASEEQLNAEFDKHAVVDDSLFLVTNESGEVVDFDSGDEDYAETRYPGHWRWFIPREERVYSQQEFVTLFGSKASLIALAAQRDEEVAASWYLLTVNTHYKLSDPRINEQLKLYQTKTVSYLGNEIPLLTAEEVAEVLAGRQLP